MRAAYKGVIHRLKVLLDDMKLDVNTKTSEGITALMYAAKGGHAEVVRVLLDRNADANAKDKDGKTALMLAEEEGHTEIVKLLKKSRE